LDLFLTKLSQTKGPTAGLDAEGSLVPLYQVMEAEVERDPLAIPSSFSKASGGTGVTFQKPPPLVRRKPKQSVQDRWQIADRPPSPSVHPEASPAPLAACVPVFREGRSRSPNREERGRPWREPPISHRREPRKSDAEIEADIRRIEALHHEKVAMRMQREEGAEAAEKMAQQDRAASTIEVLNFVDHSIPELHAKEDTRGALLGVRNLAMERYLTLTNAEPTHELSSMDKYRRWKLTILEKKAAHARQQSATKKAADTAAAAEEAIRAAEDTGGKFKDRRLFTQMQTMEGTLEQGFFFPSAPTTVNWNSRQPGDKDKAKPGGNARGSRCSQGGLEGDAGRAS